MTREELIAWYSGRCFLLIVLSRIEVEELLAKSGLTRYNRWEIVKRTGGHMSGDYFWIDFGSASQKNEASRLIEEGAEEAER